MTEYLLKKLRVGRRAAEKARRDAQLAAAKRVGQLMGDGADEDAAVERAAGEFKLDDHARVVEAAHAAVERAKQELEQANRRKVATRRG